jgi:hypothetical protein
VTPADDELSGVAAMSLADLRARWLELTGAPAPKHFRRDLLSRAVAYRLQVTREGDLSARLQRELKALAGRPKAGVPEKTSAGPALRPGARLVRTWRGELHEVTVTKEGGFNWRGRTHRSLSAIAREITGTRWNGLVFFGARTPAVAKKKGRA